MKWQIFRDSPEAGIKREIAVYDAIIPVMDVLSEGLNETDALDLIIGEYEQNRSLRGRLHDSVMDLLCTVPRHVLEARTGSPKKIPRAFQELDNWQRGFDRAMTAILSDSDYKDFNTPEFRKLLRTSADAMAMMVRSEKPITYEEALAQLSQQRAGP